MNEIFKEQLPKVSQNNRNKFSDKIKKFAYLATVMLIITGCENKKTNSIYTSQEVGENVINPNLLVKHDRFYVGGQTITDTLVCRVKRNNLKSRDEILGAPFLEKDHKGVRVFEKDNFYVSSTSGGKKRYKSTDRFTVLDTIK